MIDDKVHGEDEFPIWHDILTGVEWYMVGTSGYYDIESARKARRLGHPQEVQYGTIIYPAGWFDSYEEAKKSKSFSNSPDPYRASDGGWVFPSLQAESIRKKELEENKGGQNENI